MKAPDITVCDKISDITGAAAVKAATQRLWINKRGINKRGNVGLIGQRKKTKNAI